MKLAAVAILVAALAASIPAGSRSGCCPSPVGADYVPVWSPTGALIAFTRHGFSSGTGVDGVYVVRPDGSGLKKISASTSFSWAPGGQQLVVGGVSGLEVIDTDGRVLRRLTRHWADAYPAWSPDGQLIAFRGAGGIWVIPAKGGSPMRIARAALPRSLVGWHQILWSPAGGSLAYTAPRKLGKRWDNELHVVDAAGGRDRVLASSRADEAEPAWSPDGARIAFSTVRRGQRDVFVIGADGRSLVNLTRSRGYDNEPAWAPNGQRIAFVRKSGLYVVSAAGGVRRRITGFPEAHHPDWSPDGSRLAFSGRGDCLRPGTLVVRDNAGEPDLVSNNCHIDGTEGDDLIQGTWDRDIVHGRGGNDVISLDTSNDVAFGDEGDDVLRGDRGNDVLVGGPGRDTLIGDYGNDRLRTADGEVDELTCGPQRDWVVADRLDRINGDCERVRRVG